MKKYQLYMAAALLSFSMSSCNDALDSENYTESNTANFPTTMADAEMLVTSMYANLNHIASQPANSYLMVSELASDDRFGGGAGPSDATLDHLMYTDDTQFDFTWKMHYKGVYYANLAIEGLLKMEQEGKVSDEEAYRQMLGEAYYMRAYYYHELAELFGRVPLIVSTTQDPNSPQASADELYAQMGTDLKQAISLMSSKKYNEYVLAGHATKWAAEALMARVWMFYTGFYQKDAMPSTDGSISKAEVVAWIEDCIQNSGHALVGDFRNLWPYTNEYTVDDYAYTKDVTGIDGQRLRWAGNGNQEEVFAIKFCNFCGYTFENQEGYSNYYVPFFGLWGTNGDENTFPFGNGNGMGSVTPCLWNEWTESEPGDLRLRASIIRVEDELSDYNDAHTTGQWEDTGMWGKKMIPVLAKAAYERQGVWRNSIFWAAYPEFDVANNYGITNWGAHFQDLMIIRFADVLLMHSELTGDATSMNKVRARAGLDPVTYSLEALQRERRHELAFEGTRWGDIRRWHIAEQALTAQNGAAMNNAGRQTVMRDGRYAQRYQQTQGFFPIPLAQIQLSKGVLTQNEGWSSDARFTTWDFE